MKCNLDCGYCPTGIYGGHDNSTKHPPLDECLKTIDFMYAYADAHQTAKRNAYRKVVLNIYGGESLHHPHIVEILRECRERHRQYSDRWELTITTTTNAIVKESRFENIAYYIDNFTLSYHAENTAEQHEQFKNNALYLNSIGKAFKVVVLGNPNEWTKSTEMVEWCEHQNINYLFRHLDILDSQINQYIYTEAQRSWYIQHNQTKNRKIQSGLQETGNNGHFSKTGRACCGGREMCLDGNFKQKHFHVTNNFTGWTCSVEQWFLFVKQVNGEVYVNKDCKMGWQGRVAPIGTLADTDTILRQSKLRIESNTDSIVCEKFSCWCGLCAPKAESADNYKQIQIHYKR